MSEEATPVEPSWCSHAEPKLVKKKGGLEKRWLPSRTIIEKEGSLEEQQRGKEILTRA